MSGGEFVVGMVLFALTVGSALTFAAVVVRRRLPELAGPPRGVAFGLIAASGFVAIHLLPGALTVLGKPGVAVSAVALLGAATLVPRAPAAARRTPFPSGPPSGRLSWGLAGTALGLLALYAVAHLIDHGRDAVATVDMTTFHLPNVARWIQSGSFWQDDEFVPFRSFGTYPNTSDVFTLGAILPFDNDFLIRFVGCPFLALTGLATYSLARELTAPAASAVLFSTGFVAMPVVAFPAFEALADTFMLASFSSGLLFLMRHRRTGAPADLVLAGLGLGLSAGTKWYAPVAVGVTVAVWVGASLLERGSVRQTLQRAAALAGIVAAAGGFWLLRNLVELGNPVFPVEVSLGDLTLFDAPRDIRRERLGFSLAGYIDQPDVWRDVIWPSFRSFMSWFAVFLWAGCSLAAVLAVRQLRRPGRLDGHTRSVLVCIVIAAGIGIIYLFLPYTAQGPSGQPFQAVANSRYVVPALVLAAALGAWAAGRIGRARTALELAALLFFLDALEKNTDFNGDVSAGALAAAAVALAVLAGVAWLTRGRAVIRRRSGPALAAGACAALVVVAALYAQQERFNDYRYGDAEPTARWVLDNAPSGQHIGVAGDGFVVYQLFGPRLENDVDYVGPRVEGLLRPYQRPEEFEAAVRRGGYDLVLVQHNEFFSPGLAKRQERSLRALGYTLVASGHDTGAGDQRKTLYQAREPRRGHCVDCRASRMAIKQ